MEQNVLKRVACPRLKAQPAVVSSSELQGKTFLNTYLCDPAQPFADGLLEWAIYRVVKILLLVKMLCLIAAPSRPISLLRFQICRLVTP